MTTEGIGFLVLGAGGHGRVVADLVHACGGRVCGFIDADPDKVAAQVAGIGVVADESELMAALRSSRLPAGARALALGIGDNDARAAKMSSLPPGLLPPLVHPSAAVSPSGTLGPGVVVMANAVINHSAQLGSAVVVNSGAVVEHDCVLGEAVHVSPGSVLAGGVTVGRRSWIGAGATVIQGVSLGRDVMVGAGAVVIRDVSDGETVVGVPARPLARTE